MAVTVASLPSDSLMVRASESPSRSTLCNTRVGCKRKPPQHAAGLTTDSNRAAHLHHARQPVHCFLLVAIRGSRLEDLDAGRPDRHAGVVDLGTDRGVERNPVST